MSAFHPLRTFHEAAASSSNARKMIIGARPKRLGSLQVNSSVEMWGCDLPKEDAMPLCVATVSLRTGLFATALAFALPFSTAASSQSVSQINLTTDDPGFLTGLGFAPAQNIDPNLKNPWGMSFSTTSPFWISDQATGLSTLYDAAGAPRSLVVTIPGSAMGPSGPT